jgi:hypothetical protein
LSEAQRNETPGPISQRVLCNALSRLHQFAGAIGPGARCASLRLAGMTSFMNESLPSSPGRAFCTTRVIHFSVNKKKVR